MEEIKDKLHAHQLKATPTRVGVLDLITHHDTAIPFSRIQKSFQTTDRITLFRTLNALLESGLIHKALFQNDETYYAICPPSCSNKGHIHDHIHFKCTSCEQVTCKHLPKGIEITISDVLVHKIDINVEGICSDCQ